MGYNRILQQSAKESGNCVCMGLDPVLDAVPGADLPLRERMNQYYSTLFRRMSLSGLIPAAFKPNIGYYSALDNPRDEDFTGSLVLADVLDMVEGFFPSIPVILDSKRGDIARSSNNYRIEAFDKWNADAVTVAPYMGTDSVEPFRTEDKGVYVLCRTSNPGGKDLQNLVLEGGEPLYLATCRWIARWECGAVVGATNMDELKSIAGYFADEPVPLLIPGVGSQGGSAPAVIEALKSVNYPLDMVRINSSSGLTHPWKRSPVPSDWLDLCISNIRSLIEECAL